MSRLPNVQFRITSKTTGESHVVCTDDNGMIDTSAGFNSHKNDTNGGTAESGIWFGEMDAIDDLDFIHCLAFLAVNLCTICSNCTYKLSLI